MNQEQQLTEELIKLRTALYELEDKLDDLIESQAEVVTVFKSLYE